MDSYNQVGAGRVRIWCAKLFAPACLALALPFPQAAAIPAALEWKATSVPIPAGGQTSASTLNAETATLRVPENPQNSSGIHIELALMRLGASTKTPGAPVVYLHGGPGGGASFNVQSNEFLQMFSALRDVGDVILFDQRGAGQSKPSLRIEGKPALTENTLATREALLEFLIETSQAVRARVIAAGSDPGRYTVRESVADIEAIRRALGVPKIRLLAHSYGAQLAQAYLREHPEAVERMILIGSRGMDTARKLPAEADRFIAMIDKQFEASGSFKLDGGFAATLDRVLRRLDREPLQLDLSPLVGRPLKGRMGGDAFRFIVAKFYLNDPDNFRFLPKLLDDLEKGREPGSLYFNLRQMFSNAISLTWFTTDAANGASEDLLRRISGQRETALLRDAMNFPFPEINAVWKMPDLGDGFRVPVQSSVPVLFVAGSLDGITPPAQSAAIAKTFPNARLVVVENGGHASQLRAPGLAKAMAEFMAGRTVDATFAIPPPQFAAPK